MPTTLKKKTSRAFFWNALDKFGVQSWSFVIGLFLARVLLPEEFGLVGMLSIFTAVSQTLVDSGMASGLIQKKDKKEKDFSTVFLFNLAVSCFIYLVLFFSAPLIAAFYAKPELTTLTRVLCLTIIINALSIVQRTKVNIRLDFKTHAKANILSIAFGGLTALYLAHTGYGVWSLVVQQLVAATAAVVAYHYLSDWKPSLHFSRQSFRELFGFGSKILMVGLYGQILSNIYNMVIGKTYPTAQLGFYTRARDLAEIPAGVITSIFYSISYPLLSSLQGEQERMVMIFRRLLRLSAFINFPLMALLAVVSDPLIRFILNENWLPVIPLLQLAVFSRILYPMSSLNLNLLNAIGRSDLFLKVDITKVPLIVATLVITIPLGVKAILIGQIVVAVVAFAINAYMPGRLFGFGVVAQIKEMIPVMVATLLMAISSVISMTFFISPMAKLMVGTSVGLGTYLFFSTVLNIREIHDFRELLLEKLPVK